MITLLKVTTTSKEKDNVCLHIQQPLFIHISNGRDISNTHSDMPTMHFISKNNTNKKRSDYLLRMRPLFPSDETINRDPVCERTQNILRTR